MIKINNFSLETIVVPEGGKCFVRYNDGRTVELKYDPDNDMQTSDYDVKMYCIVFWPGKVDLRMWEKKYYGEVEVYTLTKDELTIKDIIE